MIQIVFCGGIPASPPTRGVEYSKFKIQNSKFHAWAFVQ